MKINEKQHVTYDGVLKKNPGKKPTDLLAPFRASSWSESTVKLALLRINSGKITPSQIFEANSFLYSGEGVSLEPSQVRKGYDWLMGQWKTPGGKERENSPFGGREEGVLEKFSTIKLNDFYSERGNWYVPVYRVEGDDRSFEYYVMGGKVTIYG